MAISKEMFQWLRGQVTAIRLLAAAVQVAVHPHDAQATAMLRNVERACNSVENRLDEAAKEGKANGDL